LRNGTLHSSMKCALIEDVLARGGHGDLRYTLSLRPVTLLSDSDRPTRPLEGAVCSPNRVPDASKLRGDVKQRRRRGNSGAGARSVVAESPWERVSVVSRMGLGEMDERSRDRTAQIPCTRLYLRWSANTKKGAGFPEFTTPVPNTSCHPSQSSRLGTGSEKVTT